MRTGENKTDEQNWGKERKTVAYCRNQLRNAVRLGKPVVSCLLCINNFIRKGE